MHLPELRVQTEGPQVVLQTRTRAGRGESAGWDWNGAGIDTHQQVRASGVAGEDQHLVLNHRRHVIIPAGRFLPGHLDHAPFATVEILADGPACVHNPRWSSAIAVERSSTPATYRLFRAVSFRSYRLPLPTGHPRPHRPRCTRKSPTSTCRSCACCCGLQRISDCGEDSTPLSAHDPALASSQRSPLPPCRSSTRPILL